MIITRNSIPRLVLPESTCPMTPTLILHTSSGENVGGLIKIQKQRKQWKSLKHQKSLKWIFKNTEIYLNCCIPSIMHCLEEFDDILFLKVYIYLFLFILSLFSIISYIISFLIKSMKFNNWKEEIMEFIENTLDFILLKKKREWQWEGNW